MTISAHSMEVATQPHSTWRDRIKFTRTGVFSTVFLLVSIVMFFNLGRIDPTFTTTLTFGDNLPQLEVPTRPYTLVVTIIYAVTGVVGLLPVAGLRRVKFWLLMVSGVLIIPTVLIVAAQGESINVTVMLQSSVRQATPIVMGALAGIWCERSGVVNIAIEGMMLTGAAIGFVIFTVLGDLGVTTSTGLWLGVLSAVVAGGLMALLHAWLSITFKTDQIVSGTVINILALGITSFLRREILLSSEAGRETLQQIRIPLLADIPVLGEVLFNGRPIFYSMFVLLVVTHVMLYNTRWGLRMRAVGENPHAADTLGINVNRTRYINVVIGGLIAGLAGAWFSLETTGSFDDNMTGGRGFIALAAMIFGKWTPAGSFGGGLLFGFSDALGLRFQTLGVPVPTQFLQMVPYVITMVVLAGLIGRAVAPKAIGVPYEKE